MSWRVVMLTESDENMAVYFAVYRSLFYLYATQIYNKDISLLFKKCMFIFQIDYTIFCNFFTYVMIVVFHIEVVYVDLFSSSSWIIKAFSSPWFSGKRTWSCTLLVVSMGCGVVLSSLQRSLFKQFTLSSLKML